MVEEGVLAEQVGVDFFGIGEHHTDYFPMPAGDVVLASIAARTQRIHLGSAVTVLSSDDPVRVFQRYSTLNALSNGRAEVILGRGSSIESFPLFGYDLADYEQLFEEKTALFAQLLEGGPVTWQGTTEAGAARSGRRPPPRGRIAPSHLGRCGRQPSVGHSRCPPRLLLDAGDHRWAPGALRAVRRRYSNRHSRSFGRPPLPVGVHGPGHVAPTDDQAREEFWPHWRELIRLVAVERGFAIPTEESFAYETGPQGALYVGSPRPSPRRSPPTCARWVPRAST